jgi:DNA-binding response OmpR family regulator
MLHVLLCSETDLKRQLATTVIGRQGISWFKATRMEEARLLANTVCPRVILVDRDLPRAGDFIDALREEPTTRHRSIAILAWGDLQPVEVELLARGANAVLRMPPGPGWDERLARLMNVPVRQEGRMPVQILVESSNGPRGASAAALNLSVGGMLVESEAPLPLFHELGVFFRLPDGTSVTAGGRVVRQAGSGEYGLEFVRIDDRSREAIRQFIRSASVELASW